MTLRLLAAALAFLLLSTATPASAQCAGDALRVSYRLQVGSESWDLTESRVNFDPGFLQLFFSVPQKTAQKSPLLDGWYRGKRGAVASAVLRRTDRTGGRLWTELTFAQCQPRRGADSNLAAFVLDCAQAQIKPGGQR
jgi:hypothetical protein